MKDGSAFSRRVRAVKERTLAGVVAAVRRPAMYGTAAARWSEVLDRSGVEWSGVEWSGVQCRSLCGGLR